MWSLLSNFHAIPFPWIFALIYRRSEAHARLIDDSQRVPKLKSMYRFFPKHNCLTFCGLYSIRHFADQKSTVNVSAESRSVQMNNVSCLVCVKQSTLHVSDVLGLLTDGNHGMFYLFDNHLQNRVPGNPLHLSMFPLLLVALLLLFICEATARGSMARRRPSWKVCDLDEAGVIAMTPKGSTIIHSSSLVLRCFLTVILEPLNEVVFHRNSILKLFWNIYVHDLRGAYCWHALK